MSSSQQQTSRNHYIGLMSGTSIDGIDAALVHVEESNCDLIGTYFLPLEQSLKKQLIALCRPATQLNELSMQAKLTEPVDLIGQLDHQLGLVFADAANQLLINHQLDKKSIRAIGCHGQTIRHRPNSVFPFTMQIGDPNIIAHLTGIPTVADFRRMDMAVGGQGAPLVPAFHQALMKCEHENRIILNLGGIANITFLPQSNEQEVIGFDTGPANTLLDAHFQLHHQLESYDKDAQFAITGSIDNQLLNSLLNDPYFELPPPKSTGREYFSIDWLNKKIQQLDDSIEAKSVQATLIELTTQSIADAIDNLKIENYKVFACGGGMHNQYLLDSLARKLNKKINKTNDIGVDGDYLEAMTFAWLAHQRLENLTANLPSVTGARMSKVLGAIYHP